MKLRPLTPDDYDLMMAICRRNGLSGRLSQEEWKHIWLDNPARKEFPAVGGGSLLINDEGQAVGTGDQVPRVYEWNGRRLAAVAGTTWAVDPPYRRFSLMFTEACFSQPNVDLWINSTANPAAGRIWTHYKADRLPAPWYDEPLRWTLRYSGAVAGVLSRKGVPGTAILKYPLGLAAWVFDLARGRNRYGHAPASVRPVQGFDERFDTLWARLRRKPDRLMAVRDRETLAWHFRIPLQRENATILVMEEGAELAGYAAMLHSVDEETGRHVLRVVDLQVAEENPQQVLALVSGALCEARRHGADAIEAIGFSAMKRRVMEQLGPRRGKGDCWPFFYKARDPALHAALRNPDAWDPCRYDGDASIVCV